MTKGFIKFESHLADVSKIIQSLGSELHWSPGRFSGVTVATSLDRDLGLDSLSRVELMGRIERQLGIYLGEQVYTSVETVGDVLNAIRKAKGDVDSRAAFVNLDFSKMRLKQDVGDTLLPITAETLTEVLKFHAKTHGARTHMMIHEPGRTDVALSFNELYQGSLEIASGLKRHGIIAGDSVALMLTTGQDYFFSFLGAILAGGVPVPIYPPSRPSQLEDHLHRHAEILKNCDAKILITTRQMAGGLGRLLRLKAIHLSAIVCPDELKGEKTSFLEPGHGNDLAFLQYTSGSTGAPKGVMLTHKNLLANIRAMGAALAATPKDVFVSWLPLYHDMGLIGAWLGSLYYGNLFVVMSPFAFLSQPKRWLDVIQNYGGTITAAPNFAYELCLRHVTDEEASQINLRTLRVVCNGAEAIIPETVERFAARFSKSGLRFEALMPVYGLAESSVGLAFPPLGRGPRIDEIDRELFVNRGIARAHRSASRPPMRFVGCGHPLTDHEIRIVDAADQEVPERQEGFIQFLGPSCTAGYLNQPEKTRELFHGAWLDSGDLGYLAEGDIFITGRVKDLIKHAGRNVHPEELEAIIGSLPGVRKGCVAVFGSIDLAIGTEKLVVVAESRETKAESLAELRATINSQLANILGAAPDEVLIVQPHTILKTSSGKIRRSATKKLYEHGTLGPGQSRVFLELSRYVMAALPERIFAQISAIFVAIRSAVIWLSVIGFGVLVWPVYVFWPNLKGRWLIAKMVAKLALLIAGVRVIVNGREHLSERQSIFVANHSSYIDVIILCAVLPRPVSFVSKSELKLIPGMRFTLERLGVVFVERYKLKETLADSRDLTGIVRQGKNILTFPEGTFTRRQGLLPFHLGAFLMASETKVSLAPISIRGSRSILHPDSWILRPGEVMVNFLPRIETSSSLEDEGNYWANALSLRDLTRDAILACCGEVDLGEEKTIKTSS